MDYTKVIDYSSLDTYLKCPRKFMFQYVMHFRSTRANLDLVFGSCWHYGLELAYKALQEDNTCSVELLTDLSIEGFNALWTIEGAPNWPDNESCFPKSPGHAANMYHAYWEQHLPLHRDFEILGVESNFTIDLSYINAALPCYIGKQDLVVKDPNDAIHIWDQKTAKSVNTSSYYQYASTLQTDGYLASGHIYYDAIPFMHYLVALCQKSKIAFQEYQVMKPKSSIDRFFSELAHYSLEIIQHLNLFNYELEHAKNRTDIIKCFPRRSGYVCTAYFRPCSYYDICHMRNNPLLWHNDPPQGYDVNEWDPQTQDADRKARLEAL